MQRTAKGFCDQIVLGSQKAMQVYDIESLIAKGVDLFEKLERSADDCLTDQNLGNDAMEAAWAVIDMEFRELAPVVVMFAHLIRKFQADGFTIERANDFLFWENHILHDILPEGEWDCSGLAEKEAEAIASMRAGNVEEFFAYAR